MEDVRQPYCIVSYTLNILQAATVSKLNIYLVYKRYIAFEICAEPGDAPNVFAATPRCVIEFLATKAVNGGDSIP